MPCMKSPFFFPVDERKLITDPFWLECTHTVIKQKIWKSCWKYWAGLLKLFTSVTTYFYEYCRSLLHVIEDTLMKSIFWVTFDNWGYFMKLFFSPSESIVCLKNVTFLPCLKCWKLCLPVFILAVPMKRSSDAEVDKTV